MHARAPQADNVVPCRIRAVRHLGEITSLECEPAAVPPSRLHLESTTQFVKQAGVREGSTVYLELAVPGIHIMPVRGRSGSA